MTDPAVAPYGAWRVARSGSTTSSATSSRSAEPWLDGDDVYWLEGRPAEGGRRVLVRRRRRRIDRRPDPGAVQRPDPRPRVRRRRVRRRRRRGRLLELRRRPALPARSRAPRRPSRSPRPGRGATPTCASIAARRRLLAVREDHGRRRRGRQRRSSRSPLDGDRDPRVLVDGAGLRRRAAPLARTARGSPGSSGTTRTCPGTGPRLRVAPVAAGRHARASAVLAAGGPDESIVQPEWSPDGALHFVSDRSGWWNLYRLVRRPAARAARADGGRVRRPGLDLRPLVLRVPAGRLDRGGRPARRARPPLPRRARRPRRRGRDAVHRARGPAGRRRAAIVAARRRAGRADRRRPLRPGDARPGRRAPPGEPLALDPASISRPEPIEFPTDRRPDRARALLPAAQPGVRRARTASGRRSSCSSHGGPTVERRRPRSTSASSS